MGSDKIAEEEGEDLDDEYDEEEEEDDDDRPRKKPKHGGFILDEAGTHFLLQILIFGLSLRQFFNAVLFYVLSFFVSSLFLDVDDEYEDEEDQWEEGAEDILEKGKKLV